MEPGTCGTRFPLPPFLDDFDLHEIVRLDALADAQRFSAVVGALGEHGEVFVWTELHDLVREGPTFADLHDGCGPEGFNSVTTVLVGDGHTVTVVVETDPSPSYLAELAEAISGERYPLVRFATEAYSVFLRPDPGGIDVLAAEEELGRSFAAPFAAWTRDLVEKESSPAPPG